VVFHNPTILKGAGHEDYLIAWYSNITNALNFQHDRLNSFINQLVLSIRTIESAPQVLEPRSTGVFMGQYDHRRVAD
jgi:hypothetical protein